MASTSDTGHQSSTAISSSQDLTTIDTPRSSVGHFDTPARTDSAFRAKIRDVYPEKYSTKPRGLDEPHNMCYRNAVLVMLLTSDLFMQYVIWHTDELAENGLGGDYIRYVDPLTEPSALSDVYWQGTTPLECATAISTFWSYVKNVKQEPWPRKGSIRDQQDAQEFLSWLFSHVRSALQSEYHFETVDRFDQMIHVGHVNRHICANCGAKNPTKHRIPWSPPGDFLMLELKTGKSSPRSESTPNQSPHTIDQLLQSSVRSVASGYYCPRCDSLWETRKSAFNDEEAKKAAISEKQSKDARQWTNLQTLPEVMFLYIKRFDYKDKKPMKDSTFVKLDEEIDVESLLDKTIKAEDRQKTKYRLRSVISHAGKAGSGHYRTHVRSVVEGRDRWYCIDGKMSEEVDFKTINDDQESWTPYLLCWERTIDDGSVAAAVPVQLPVSSTEARSSSKSSSSSYSSQPISSESMKSSRTNSQDSDETNINPSSEQTREMGTISEPSHGVLRAKVTIAGQTYRFEDLDITLPPQFHTSVKNRKPLDVKVRTKLIASNSVNPIPRFVAYDLGRMRKNQPDEGGWRDLTQDSLTKVSRRDGRKASKREEKFAMTYKFVRSLWEKDPAAWLKFDPKTINKIVRDGQRAEKANKAISDANEGTDGKPDERLQSIHRIVSYALQEEYARINNKLLPRSPSDDDEDMPSHTAPLQTPKSRQHSELKEAIEQTKTHAGTTTQRKSKSPSLGPPSLTRSPPEPHATRSPTPMIQNRPEKQKKKPTPQVEEGSATRTRSPDTRARGTATDSSAAKATTTAATKGRTATAGATKASKAQPKANEEATAVKTSTAAPMTRARKRERDEAAAEANADELAGDNTIEVAQPAPKKPKTAAKTAAKKKTPVQKKKAQVTTKTPTKKTATKKPAPKQTTTQTRTGATRTRSQKSPTPSEPAPICGPNNALQPANPTALPASKVSPTASSTPTTDHDFDPAEQQRVQDLILQQQQSQHTRAPSPSPTSSSSSTKSNSAPHQTSTAQQDVQPTIAPPRRPRKQPNPKHKKDLGF